MDWYSVTVEARSPDGTGTLDDNAVALFADRLTEHHGAVSAGGIPPRYSATFSCESPTAERAASYGADLVRMIAHEAGLPPWPIVHFGATRADVLDEELARSPMPDLVSGPEAAEILDVSPQRFHRLATEHKGFPEPAYRLRAGKLWHRAAIVKFGEEWTRKPGRPRLSS